MDDIEGNKYFLDQTGNASAPTPLTEEERALFDQFTPHARRIAFKVYRTNMDAGRSLSEFESDAHYGLLRAVKRVDATKAHDEIVAYVIRFITGNINHSMRDWFGGVRAHFDKDTDEFVPEKIIRNKFSVVSGVATSLDAPLKSDDAVTRTLQDVFVDRLAEDPLDLAIGAIDPTVNAEMKRIIRGYPERDRTILFLLFYEEKSQREIGEIVGISQMHVSRRIKWMLENLRTRLGSDEEQSGTIAA